MTDNPLPYAALLSDRQAELEKRVASLEKYRVDYMQVCERVARLEQFRDWGWEVLMDNLKEEIENYFHERGEPLPWGDLD